MQALHRRATAAPALAFLAALATAAATALPPPKDASGGEGAISRRITRSASTRRSGRGEGEYPGRKSGMDVKLINANLDCNENFVKGFGVSEFIVTPAILGLAAVLANINKGTVQHSGSAAAPAASAPSTAAAPRTSCASGKSL